MEYIEIYLNFKRMVLRYWFKTRIIGIAFIMNRAFIM